MRANLVRVACGLVLVAVAACSGGGSKSASSSTTSSQGSTAASTSTGSGSNSSGSGSATFDARGCAAPSADAIGTAFGAAITSTTPAADNGCLWNAGGVTRGVQVSYHTPADFSDARLAVLKTGSTPVSVPGANDAFVKHLTLPNGTTNDIEYVVFDNGTVEIAFTGPTDFLTAQNEGAVTTLIVG